MIDALDLLLALGAVLAAVIFVARRFLPNDHIGRRLFGRPKPRDEGCHPGVAAGGAVILGDGLAKGLKAARKRGR